MHKPTEPGYYWYQEPNEIVKMCYVYNHPYHQHLRIIFLDESRQSFPLSVIEPETQFKKIDQHIF